MITYTLLSAIALIAVFVLGIIVWKSELFSRVRFWIAYVIVLFFQLLTNGYLTGQDVVTYNPEAITGTRIAYAPIEDLFFGFSLVTLTIFIWEKLGSKEDTGIKEDTNPESLP